MSLRPSLPSSAQLTRRNAQHARLSGTKDASHSADAIIHHPSVRSMPHPKAIAEGGRSMLYECAQIADQMLERERAGGLAGAKKFDDELGFVADPQGFLTEVARRPPIWGSRCGAATATSRTTAGATRLPHRLAVEGPPDPSTRPTGRKIMLQKLKPINRRVPG